MNNKTTSDQTNNQTTDDQTIMREVIEECQSKGYLVSFLEKHRNELENIMIEEMEYAESSTCAAIKVTDAIARFRNLILCRLWQFCYIIVSTKLRAAANLEVIPLSPSSD